MAFEINKRLRPSATVRFAIRFRGLVTYYHHSDQDRTKEIREQTTSVPGLTLVLRTGHPSAKFIPLVIDALLTEYLGHHRFNSPLERRALFCEHDLASFIKKYFPDIDQRRAEFKEIQRICREMSQGASAGNRLVRPSSNTETPRLESRYQAWRDLLATAALAARSRAPILLSGESGTGKEVLARFIHQHSPQAQGPFVAVNCGAVPENLLESELFGYRRGAFTEARQDKPGLAAQAHGGTLFLDEIGETTLRFQVKFLRFLQDHSFLPLGGIKMVRVDVRVIAASNLDLDQARQTGAFRQDLFYRLNVFQLYLPPLRERIEDLPELADHFIAKYNLENATRIIGLTKDASMFLLKYNWPGNIRELENVIQRAVILAGQGLIRPEHLPPALIATRAERPAVPTLPTDRQALVQALDQALALPPGAKGQRRRLAQSVPLDHLARFFEETGSGEFPPRELADYVSRPGHWRRYKLAHTILNALLKTGLVKRTGGRAQAARYRLNSTRLSPWAIQSDQENVA
ncbi:MAG: sigma 54-interacting transcriptional regulator [Thermodesulfobacteriota bacterium]